MTSTSSSEELGAELEVARDRSGKASQAEEDAEKENRRGTTNASSQVLYNPAHESSQMSQESQDLFAVTDPRSNSFGLPSSSTSAEPSTSQSCSLNASKFTQSSSDSDLELRLEETQPLREDPPETQPLRDLPETQPLRDLPETQPLRDLPETQPLRDLPETQPLDPDAKHERPAKTFDLSQWSMGIESSSPDSQEPSSIILPGLGSTPSPGFPVKRSMSIDNEFMEEQKRIKLAEEDTEHDIFDLDEDEEDETPEKNDDNISSCKSIVIDSPCLDKEDKSAIEENKAINEEGDDSVVILEENLAENPSTSRRELPKLRMPQTSFSTQGNCSNQDTNSSNSESPFTRLSKLKPVDENASLSSSQGIYNVSASADDEASSSLTAKGGLNSSESLQIPTVQQLVNDSPSNFISPIEHLDMNKEPKRSRVSSTPSIKVTKKRILSKKSEVSPSSDEDLVCNSTKRLRALNTSPKKCEEFKKPRTMETRYFILIGGKNGLTADELESIKKRLGGKSSHDEYVIPKEKTQLFHANVQNASAIGSPEQFRKRPSRLSDASTSSSMSRSSSASGGYLADGSSSSSLSGGSKRDRLSMVPEATVEYHTVVPPLPNSSRQVKPKKKRERKRKSCDKVVNALDSNENSSKLQKVIPAEGENSPDFEKGVPQASSPNPSKDQIVENESKTIAEASTNHNEISEGCQVFAKFIERTQYRYWPAVVKSKTFDAKWLVKFDDKKERTLPEDELIPMTALIPSQTVSVILKDEEAGVSHVGVLTQYPCFSEGKVQYEVKLNEIKGIATTGPSRYYCEDMFLTAEQGKEIKKYLGGRWMTPTVSMANLDLGNIINDKRIRQRPQPFVASPMSTPAKSKTPLSAKRKKGGTYVETSAGETTDAENKSRSKRKPGSVLMSSTSDDEKETPSKLTKLKRKGRRLVEIDADNVKMLFEGMSFVLTQGSRKPAPPVQGIETETEEDSEVNQSFSSLNQSFSANNDGPPFNRRELRDLIAKHGGTVLESFPGDNQVVPKDLILLTDRKCETMAYLLALAFGFQRVSHQWVLHSISQKKKLPLNNYYLPIGYSKVDQKEIDYHEIKGLKDLLKGCNVLLTSTSTNFIEDWKPLLTRVGASVCSRTTGHIDSKLKPVDLVLADTERPCSIMDDAKKKSIPVVSPEWIIQSLINGKRLNTANYVI